MIVFPIFFMHIIYVSFSFDLELEGAMHASKDLLKRIGMEIGQPLRSHGLVQLMASEIVNKPVNRYAKNQYDGNIYKVSDEFRKIVEYPLDNEKERNPAPVNHFKTNNDVFRFNLTHQLSVKGSHKLSKIAQLVKKSLKTDTNINKVLKDATNSYLAKVKSYYNAIRNKTVANNLEEEYVVLDMIETTNKILLNEAHKLLDAIIDENYSQGKLDVKSSSLNIPMLITKIKYMVMQEKTAQFQNICKILHVCKIFPGYSDHIATMLKEILKLEDYNFNSLVRSLKVTLAQHRDFFKRIMKENVINKITSAMVSSLNNMYFMKELFSMLRAVIIKRYKIYNGINSDISIKTKAVRILLDLIDKALEGNSNYINSIDIELTIGSYKEWAIGKRDDVDKITKDFIDNAIAILNYYWSKETKEEVKVLADVIATGAAENKKLYDYLFRDGSKFIRGLETPSIH